MDVDFVHPVQAVNDALDELELESVVFQVVLDCVLKHEVAVLANDDLVKHCRVTELLDNLFLQLDRGFLDARFDGL